MQLSPVSAVSGDTFGASVSMAGGWLMCGAPVTDTDGSEMNGSNLLSILCFC